MLNVIQYLRAAAALLVVAYHVGPRLTQLGYAGAWPTWPSAGVDLFFVISGFLMWTTTVDGPGRPKQFMMRRLERIVPMYWLLTTIVLAIMLVAPSTIASGGLGWAHALSSFFFIPIEDPGNGRMEPLIPQGWTLNFEMAFYALFAASLWLNARLRLSAILAALIFVALLSFVRFDRQTVLGFYADQIVLEFAFGVVLGAMWRGIPATGVATSSQTRLLGTACLALGIALFAALTAWLPDLHRTWKWGAPAALIVFGALRLEGVVTSPPLRALGDASYSIYLSHGIVLSAALVAWEAVGLASTPVAVAAFALAGAAAATLAGWCLYQFVEKPMMDFFRRTRSPTGRPDLIAAAQRSERST